MNMTEDEFQKKPEELPSPEELFRMEDDNLETVSAVRQKPFPHYREVRWMTAGFLAAIVILVILILSMGRMGIHTYYMASDSMESSIPKGSLLVVKEVDTEKLRAGDVITFRNRDGLCVTHQIVEVVNGGSNEGGRAFRTKGTENEHADKDIVESKRVVGRVLFFIPYIGKLFMLQ